MLRLGQAGVELTGMHDGINKVVQILPFASEVSRLCVCVCVCVCECACVCVCICVYCGCWPV